MKPNLKFTKGQFITQCSSPESFAIFGGEAYDPIEPGSGVDYSLICYYNPYHYTKDGKRWVCEDVFEYDLEDNDHDETCEYTINANDMEYWRACTQQEVDKAIKTLADKKLAWIQETNKFRKLAIGEQLKFGHQNGGNVNKTSPIYNTPGIVNPNYRGSSLNTNTRKMITTCVKENWEQKEPISTMDDERRVFVIGQCDKLKYAFDSYGYNCVRVYPQNGAQIPRRSYRGEMGYGMCAYNALMQGDNWGYYDCE